MQDRISSAGVAGAAVATRTAALCLGPEAGGRFELRRLPRRQPAADEIEIAVEAAAINPIDVRRAAGYGRRVLSLIGAARFPMTLGNDFAGTVVAVGERVYGVKPPSGDGAHASHIVAKAGHARKAPDGRDLRALAALPYRFITMWLAATAAGLTRENAPGKKVLVNGAAGGLGTLAAQTLSKWGVSVTGVVKASDLDACIAAGAAEAVDRNHEPLRKLGGRFDATLNLAVSDDDPALIACLLQGALGHATTVHPMMHNFDERGFLSGAFRTFLDKKAARSLLPKGTSRCG
ncbi:MAG: alcohol dehydrogenase catalytic domain-containing protein [Hyphomicrobiales bacterium]|nr:alcohol dehydrogenase catalytic domain-containing protein [Hyphomicrobiales bacterium]